MELNMKRYIASSLMILALLTMGFSFALSHAPAAHAWSRAFNSTPDSYSYVAYASIPTDASQMAHTNLGPYGSSWVGCTTSHTAKEGNSVNKLALGKLATVLAGNSFVSIDRAKANSYAQATVNAHTIDVLQGTITADKIQATSNSDMTASNASSTADSIWFAHLSIGGKPFEEYVPTPNTKVTLDGLGYVMLNEQYPVTKGNMTRAIVNMIHVYITQENNQVRNGAQIIIGHTETSITRTYLPHILRSNVYDYSASMRVSLKNLGGPTIVAHISCTGGSSQTHSVSQLPFVLGHSGLAVENTTGRILANGSNNNGLVHISNLHMLQGLIDIESLNVSAYVERSAHTTHRANATLMNAHIAGITFNSPVHPNTRIQLNGLGDITLNKQSSVVNKSYIEQQVNALDIHVTQKNNWGFPIGAHIIIGHITVAISNY
jgi:hypothetical protein